MRKNIIYSFLLQSIQLLFLKRIFQSYNLMMIEVGPSFFFFLYVCMCDLIMHEYRYVIDGLEH